MITEEEKRKIKESLGEYCQRMGSQNRAVATMSGISTATVSKILQEDWETISDKMWRSVASQTGYSDNTWRIARTSAYDTMLMVLGAMKEDSLVTAVIGSAGCGKTEAIKQFCGTCGNVYHLSCSEYWNRHTFTFKLMKAVGLEAGGQSISMSVDILIEHLKKQDRPIIILDEADKLSDSVLYFFITIYNQLEYRCGIVLCATHYLEKRIEKGLRTSRKGYQEIYSRLGRKFVRLPHLSSEDMKEIITSNGITSPKDVQRIIDDSEGDLRRIRRMVWAIAKKEQERKEH